MQIEESQESVNTEDSQVQVSESATETVTDSESKPVVDEASSKDTDKSLDVAVNTEAKEEKSEPKVAQRKTDINKVIAFLAERFPQSFTAKGSVKPLKIGIFADISAAITDEDPVSKTQIRQALRRYTNSWRYLDAVTKGGQRIDLQGNDFEEVTQEHIDHASTQLAESKAKFQERKKAEQAKKRAENKASGKEDANISKRKHNPPKRTNRTNKVGTSRVNKGSNESGKVNVIKESKPLVANEDFSIGKSVLVKLGSSPVSAVITDISKGEVSVQLSSGMMIKVSKENIFQA